MSYYGAHLDPGKKENASTAVTAETQEKPKLLQSYSDFTTSGAAMSIERILI